MSAADDALDVARFCWPGEVWRVYDGSRCLEFQYPDGSWSGPRFDPCHYQAQGTELYGIAAAERVLVERGLAEQYGYALTRELRASGSPRLAAPFVWSDVASIRTAPLEVCLRSMARVVREKQPKETK